MCFARLICAQAELQPFKADAKAATLHYVLDLAKRHVMYIEFMILTWC